MAGRCICELGAEGGPTTHRGVVHLSTCPHSTLKATTRKYKPVKVRRVAGTRRIVVDESEPVTKKKKTAAKRGTR